MLINRTNEHFETAWEKGPGSFEIMPDLYFIENYNRLEINIIV